MTADTGQIPLAVDCRSENQYPLAWLKLESLFAQWLRMPELSQVAVGDLTYNAWAVCAVERITQVFSIVRTITFSLANEQELDVILSWSFGSSTDDRFCALLQGFYSLGFVAVSPTGDQVANPTVIRISIPCSTLISLASRAPDAFAHTLASDFDPCEAERVYNILASVPREVMNTARFGVRGRRSYGGTTNACNLDERCYSYALYAWARLFVWAPDLACLNFPYSAWYNRQFTPFFPIEHWEFKRVSKRWCVVVRRNCRQPTHLLCEAAVVANQRIFTPPDAL